MHKGLSQNEATLFRLDTIEGGRSQLSPYTGSTIFFGALLVNWLLLFVGFYVWLPLQLADFLFTAVWIFLIIGAAFFAIKEFRNNRGFAFFLSGFTLITAMLVFLMHGIASM